MKCCWMLQNTRVTAFTAPELLRENQQGQGLGGGGGGITLPTKIRVKFMFFQMTKFDS